MKSLLTLILMIAMGIIQSVAQTTLQNTTKYIQVKLKQSSPVPNGTNGLSTSNSRLNSIFIRYGTSKFKPILSNPKRGKFTKYFIIECTGNIDSLKSKLDSLGAFDEVVVFAKARTTSCSNPVNVNDPELQWGGWNTLNAMEAKCAWSLTTGNPDIKVAVVDVDIDINQPDLQNKIPYYEQQGVTNLNNRPSGWIGGSHGTRVLGVVAAQSNNGIGIASIGYNTKCSFYAADNVGYSAPSSSWGSTSGGIIRAFDDGNKIISVSFNGTGLTTQQAQDLVNNGTLLIVSAGNNVNETTNHIELWDVPGVIIVGEVDEDNNHGPTATSHYTGVDLCAMVKIRTTDEPTSSFNPTNGPYPAFWGTSSCAPQVAGTAALMLSVNPCLTPAEIEEIIKSTTEPIADASSFPGIIGTGRLNAYKAVLKASQWGNASLEVTNGQNITLNSKMMYDNIYVRTGGTLTISNTTIYMDTWGKIVVEKGGKLYINNSTVCSHPVNSCITQPYVWKGIEVEGQPTYDQMPTSNQGYVLVSNNSILKDARNCISTFPTDANGNIIWSKAGGGIIVASNSTFTNNWRHVELTSYHRQKTNGVEQNNLCRFTSCIFETDLTQLTASNQAFQKMFTNWDTKGVGIYGCTFKNTNGGVNMNVFGADHGTGLLTYDASMFIQDKVTFNPNYASSPSVFYDLSIGVEDYHSTTNPLNGHIIKKNTFERDIYGIQQTNNSSSHIYRNTFKMEYPTAYPNYTKSGFWGINAGGFQISENTFNNTTSYNFNEIGSTFKHSQFSGGGLYMLNSHTNTYVGGQTEQGNQLLNYKCNGHNSERLAGITLNPKFPTSLPKDPVSWLPFFGNCPDYPIHKANTFSSNSWDINNYTNATKQYVVVNGTGNPNEPASAKCQSMTIIACPSAFNENCSVFEPAEPNGWEPVDGKKPAFLGKKADVIGIKQPILDGAAQSLIDLIGQGTNVSANDLYDALYGVSPYLSDAVMIAMLQSSQHLSEQQVVDVLVSNSRLTQTVINAFSYRNFSQSALNTIDAAQSSTSARETLEAEIAQGERDLNDLRIDLINYYLAGSLNDTLNDYGDSTIAMLEDEDDEFSIRQLASIYIDKGETVLASQKLALLDDSEAENEQFITLMNVLIDLKEDDKNVFQLSSEQEETVRDVAATSTSTAYYAKAILALVFEEYTIERPVQIEEGLGKRGNETTSLEKGINTSANNNYLKVYPNPATNIAIADYMFVKPVKSAKIVVTNIMGATVKTIDLKQMSGQYEIDMQALNAGIYFIELRGNNDLISVKKLIINK